MGDSLNLRAAAQHHHDLCRHEEAKQRAAASDCSDPATRHTIAALDYSHNGDGPFRAMTCVQQARKAG